MLGQFASMDHLSTITILDAISRRPRSHVLLYTQKWQIMQSLLQFLKPRLLKAKPHFLLKRNQLLLTQKLKVCVEFTKASFILSLKQSQKSIQMGSLHINYEEKLTLTWPLGSSSTASFGEFDSA